MQKLIECPNCHKLNPNRLSHRHPLPDVTELGMSCQHCKRWASFGFYNNALIERQQTLTNRRRERAYRRDYDLFQVEVEGRLANEPT